MFGGDEPFVKKMQSVGKGTKHGPAVGLAAGEYHAHVVLKDGKVLLMGRNGNSGSTNETPVIVKGSENFFVTNAECGNQHSFFLTKIAPIQQRSAKNDQTKAPRRKSNETQSKTQEDKTQTAPFRDYQNAILRNQPHHFGEEEAVPRIHSAFTGDYMEPSPESVAETIRDALADVTGLEAAYKNPCYFAQDGRFRCLPYFSIIGVSKCGTTDLYAKLEKITNFMTSKNKGPHFWDENHPWDWYLDIYDDFAQVLHDSKTSNETITCDASSNTFSYSGVGVRGSKNQQVLLPEVLKSIQPDMKLILMLRDPVKRIFSAYWYYGCLYGIYKHYGKMSSQSFHKFVSEKIDTMKKCMVEDGYSARYCAVKKFSAAEQLVKGMYSMSMPDWLAVYPKNMIKIIKLEEFSKRPKQHLREVLRFLNFPEPSESDIDAAIKVEANRGNIASQEIPECRQDRGKMLPETEILLQDFYRPFNHHLATILGREEFKWEY
ncbi:hypothetical protein BSKO_12712 [Bryopsis sp. KO-2023]|nr:hypothetical protein BSKO_12712 [Bryopsis sp. KO-2023]